MLRFGPIGWAPRANRTLAPIDLNATQPEPERDYPETEHNYRETHHNYPQSEHNYTGPECIYPVSECNYSGVEHKLPDWK